MVYVPKQGIRDSSGNEALVNSQGRLNVVQHSHIDSTALQFHVSDIAASQDFILVDISDTANYPHLNSGYIHIESCTTQVDSDANGDYVLDVGYLENVDAANGDMVCVYTLSGTKKTGNTQTIVFNGYPNAPKCTSSNFVSSCVNLNDVAFQTDVNLASTLDPATADTPSGDGDLVLRVTRAAGVINVLINISYHTHS